MSDLQNYVAELTAQYDLPRQIIAEAASGKTVRSIIVSQMDQTAYILFTDATVVVLDATHDKYDGDLGIEVRPIGGDWYAQELWMAMQPFYPQCAEALRLLRARSRAAQQAIKTDMERRQYETLKAKFEPKEVPADA